MSTVSLPIGASLTDHDALGKVLTLATPHAVAAVAVHGATVLSFKPNSGPSSGRDLLWLSPDAKAAEGKAIRGGIPLCGPWFGPHATVPSAPVHGLIRTRPWTLIRVDPTNEGSGLRAEFILELPPGVVDGLAPFGYAALHGGSWRDTRRGAVCAQLRDNALSVFRRTAHLSGDERCRRSASRRIGRP